MLRVLLCSVLCVALCAQAAEQPVLSLGKARFLGESSTDGVVETYRAVPFAQPPVGNLRWAAPQPITYPTGDYPSTDFAPACYQGSHIVEWYRDLARGFGGDPAKIVEPAVDEDCLYLNVWRPARESEELLPIIVYVHGGSNRGGWSYEPNYHGHELARRGVVVITVAYRLGPLGFFAHPELSGDNFALRDLVAALQWVNHWGNEIGGDTTRITLMGESAGASNISQLLAVPSAKGLFHRLIHQSAGWMVSDPPDREVALGLGEALQQRLGVSGLKEMRTIPVDEVHAVAEQLYDSAGFDPVAGGSFLPTTLKQRLDYGVLPAIDLLIGSNADEWKMYLEEGETLKGWLEQNLPENAHNEVLTALEPVVDERHALDLLHSAEFFVCPSLRLARAVEQAGGKSWVYFFTRVRTGDMARAMGAYHGAELPYVFNTHDSWLPTAESDRALSKIMMDYWVNFARTGNPNNSKQPEWNPFEGRGEQVLRLDVRPAMISHPSAALCKALNSGRERGDGA